MNSKNKLFRKKIYFKPIYILKLSSRILPAHVVIRTINKTQP